MKATKTIFFPSVLVLVIIIVSQLYNKSHWKISSSSEDSPRIRNIMSTNKSQSTNKGITITYFGKKSFYFSKMRRNFEHCYKGRYLKSSEHCAYSDLRDDFQNSDAIVMRAMELHGTAYNELIHWHKKRDNQQMWVFFENEPPYKLWNRVNVTTLEYMFNLTATISTKSDVPLEPDNKRLRKCSRNTTKWESLNKRDFSSGKRNNVSAVWFVSNCKTQSKREIYVKELQKHMEVDIYGRCGPKRCGSNKLKTWKNSTCHEHVLQTYRFYLAFENSICEDYVTEKLWKLQGLDVVPVVMGGVNYSSMLPTGSYIDVRNFSSPGALAGYLLSLASDKDLYNQYVRNWRSLDCNLMYKYIPWDCQLCRKLHELKGKTQTVDKVSEFLGEDRCIRPEVYHKPR